MDLKLITFSNNLCTTGNLYRTYDDCVHADELICHTMELPWLDNKTFISCIPAGDYVIQMVVSPTHGNVYKIKDVVGRTHILFHVANKPSQLEGCIAPCMDFGVLDGEWAGLSSERAFTKLMNLLGGEKHNLKIRRF